MKNIYIPLVCIVLIISSCSTGQKALDRGDYYQAIKKAVERLQSDTDNKNAIQVLEDGYPLAIQYYQEEIDLALSGNDQFKWGKTLEIMEKINELSELIRRTPAARKIVSEPKIYSSEIRPAKEKAAAECYNAGMQLMQNVTRESAREAYSYFMKADKMVPGYEDVNKMIAKSKDLATLKVIVEQVPVFSERYSLAADFFYDQVMGMLRYNFPTKSFVNFYSVNEANNQNIKYPDMILKMNFYDFSIGRNQHDESTENLNKTVEEKVQTKGSNNETTYVTKTTTYKGTIKIINDQVISDGALDLLIYEFQGERILVKDRIPGQFIWNNTYGVYVGDKEALDSRHQQILSNQAYPPPAPQDLFVALTKPIFDQVTSRLRSYFGKFN